MNDHENKVSASKAGSADLGSGAELTVGQEIEAWYGGRLAHRGRVSNTLRSKNLFWIYDAAVGTDRLLDTEEFNIRPVPERATAARTAEP